MTISFWVSVTQADCPRGITFPDDLSSCSNRHTDLAPVRDLESSNQLKELQEKASFDIVPLPSHGDNTFFIVKKKDGAMRMISSVESSKMKIYLRPRLEPDRVIVEFHNNHAIWADKRAPETALRRKESNEAPQTEGDFRLTQEEKLLQGFSKCKFWLKGSRSSYPQDMVDPTVTIVGSTGEAANRPQSSSLKSLTMDKNHTFSDEDDGPNLLLRIVYRLPTLRIRCTMILETCSVSLYERETLQELDQVGSLPTYCRGRLQKLEKLARNYFNEIVANIGVPVSIISDREFRFAGTLNCKLRLECVSNLSTEPIEGSYERDVKKLKRRRILLVKVRWNSWQGAEYTWEHEDLHGDSRRVRRVS
ncbi:hypothetical protein Tco_0011320 [Tanacetum coccineum]